MRNPYKPVNPDQRIRDLRKAFKGIQKGEPGAERVPELAEFVRMAHDERMINMVMHAANLCLDEDPDAPAALIAVYTSDERPADRLHSYSDLHDLGGWIGRPDFKETAVERARSEAPAWVAAADPSEQRIRLRDLESWFGREFADDVRDEVERGK